jgi:hypothetical protein
MNVNTAKLQQIEQERQQRLAELNAEQGPQPIVARERAPVALMVMEECLFPGRSC